MARYHGGDQVRAGFFWAPSRWEIVPVSKREGVLPGTKEVGYRRIPLVLLALLGPVMGALYVVFLPFIGFAMVLWLTGKKLALVVGKDLRFLTRPLAAVIRGHHGA